VLGSMFSKVSMDIPTHDQLMGHFGSGGACASRRNS